jgi:preprotein translocase subunit YajC
MLFASLLLAAENEGAGGGSLSMFLPMILMFVALYFIVIRPGQKRDKMQREMLLKNLKKNDKVLTSAGIIGIVASVSDKEEELTIKVDESSNVRLRILKSAIIRNYSNEEAAKQQAEKDKPAAGKDEPVAAAKS